MPTLLPLTAALTRQHRRHMALAAGLGTATSLVFIAPGVAAAQTAPSAASITRCVRSAVAPGRHASLTPAEAERCAPGAPVYHRTLPASGPGASVYIVVQHSKATIYSTRKTATISKPSAGPRARMRSAASNASGCWWQWTSGSVNWWGGDNGGSINAGGWGNHCGYSYITGYTLSKWCVCTGMSYSSGSYDSNYGGWAYNYPYAAVWANGELSTSFVSWQNFIRLYENSYGGWWSYVNLG